MVIQRLNPNEVLSKNRQIMGLPNNHDDQIDDIFLASLLRRSAGINSPCSKTTLRSSLLDSLKFLVNDENLSVRIDNLIENLIVGGDLLEFQDILTDNYKSASTWIFPAPPSFVRRPNGWIYLLGIVPDQDNFLPTSISNQINYEGFLRVIRPIPEQDLVQELKDQGLNELYENTWLKGPNICSAEKKIDNFNRLLKNQSPTGIISDIKILDTNRKVNFYKSRWTVPTNQSGIFVARRPQEYGSDLWCCVRLNEGSTIKLIDLPLKKSQWRGCDDAWHLQMALDSVNGYPQMYRKKKTSYGVRFDFFSPLPQWSQRRLMILGQSLKPDKSLISFEVSNEEANSVEDHLQKLLWLNPMNDK